MLQLILETWYANDAIVYVLFIYSWVKKTLKICNVKRIYVPNLW